MHPATDRHSQRVRGESSPSPRAYSGFEIQCTVDHPGISAGRRPVHLYWVTVPDDPSEDWFVIATKHLWHEDSSRSMRASKLAKLKLSSSNGMCACAFSNTYDTLFGTGRREAGAESSIRRSDCSVGSR